MPTVKPTAVSANTQLLTWMNKFNDLLSYSSLWDGGQLAKLTDDAGLVFPLASGGNLNNLKGSSTKNYVPANAVNSPLAVAGVVDVDAVDANNATQVFTTLGTGLVRKFSRNLVANTWTAWTEYASTSLASTSNAGLMSPTDKTTLGNAQLFRLTENDGRAKTVPAETDMNTLVEAGNWMVSTQVNTPTSGISYWHFVEVLKHNASYVTQKATRFAAGADVRTYIRQMDAGVWLPWRRIPDTNLIGTLVMGNKLLDTLTANFYNKSTGNTTTNPHRALRGAPIGYHNPATALPALSEYTSNNEYLNIANLDSSMTSSGGSANTSGAIGQNVFSFNLIEHIQRTYGTIPGSTTADKVAWLKSNISKMVFNWYGVGSSVGGNKASSTVWYHQFQTYEATKQTHTNSTVAKLTVPITTSAGMIATIDASGIVHFIAHAEPSDGTTSSVLSTDYAELQVELSTDIRSNLPLATTTSSGAMSPADKSALDGAQKAKLTLDNGRSGQKNAVDLNNEKVNTFFYVGTDALNRPDGVAGGWIQVESVNDSYVTQTFKSTLNGTLPQTVYTRTCHNGVWQPWRKLVDSYSLASMFMGNKVTDFSVTSFQNKVVNSLVESPHKVNNLYGATALATPNFAYGDTVQSVYDRIKSIDAQSIVVSNTGAGQVSHTIFMFNLLEHMQRTYGTIPGATTTDKVAWLKTNISRITFNWWGYGSVGTVNKASLSYWTGSSWSYWTGNTATSPAKSTITTGIITSMIQSDGFVHFVAHADPSDGTLASTIYTDYVELVVELGLDSSIGSKPQWINATLQNSWVEYDSTQVPKFTLGRDGFVDLVGSVKSGVLGQTVFTLPVGYRPSKMIVGLGIGAPGNHYRVIIATSGAVTIDQSVGTNGNAAVYLDNIRFPVL